MQEAVIAVLKYGFVDLKLNSIEAVPDSNNSKSIKLLNNNNFQKETSHKVNPPLEKELVEKGIYRLANPFLRQ